MRLHSMLVPSLVALVIGGLAGAGFATERGSRATAHVANQSGHIGAYSYGDSRCRNPVDPISVIFVGRATTSNVNAHAAHHSGWNYSGPSSGQYFYNHGCKRPTGDIASAGLFAPERYHLRHVSGVDATQGTYSLSTPHHEDLVNCGGTLKHAVDSNWDEDPGGFVAAKWRIADTWHYWNSPPSPAPSPSPHLWVRSEYWNNTAGLWQCDGQPAWNDGWVDFVEIR